jgi:ABC-type oligopeptide transport system ATPase subunit
VEIRAKTDGADLRLSLRIRGLKKAFVDVQAVDGIDLEVAKGECFGLLGPNGAGKATEAGASWICRIGDCGRCRCVPCAFL